MFAPPCLEMPTDQGLRLHNEGDVEHNFSVEGVSGIDVDVSPGDENNTEATGLAPGDVHVLLQVPPRVERHGGQARRESRQVASREASATPAGYG